MASSTQSKTKGAERKFPKLDVIDQCSVDNWGMPYQTREPFHKTYNSQVKDKCQEVWKNVREPASKSFENALALLYPSTEDFGSFTGFDLIPENHHLFPPSSEPFWGRMDTTKYPSEAILGQTCETENEDGSRWTMQRLGPMKTTGCYDWTQMGWDNIFNLEEKLVDHPDGIFIVEQFSGPVAEDGSVLPHPDLHIHHIHVGPKPGVRQRQDPEKCFLNSNKGGTFEGCYKPIRVMEQHGDYYCRDEDGGLDCFTESVPDGYGKLVTEPLGMEGDMNDVRACNSPVMEYYYQIGIRWVPKVAKDGTVSPLKPVNFYNFIGAGDVNVYDQRSHILTFQVPTAFDSIYWYTGRMPHGGKMVRNKFHVHNKVFHEALIFAATPAELGLTKENNLVPDKAYKPMDVRDRGFTDIHELKKFVLDNLAESQKNYVGHEDPTAFLTDDLVSREKPKAFCHVVADLEEVEGYFYDRKAPTCCLPWTPKQGEIFTAVGFNSKLDYDLGPHSQEVPPTFPAHISQWMYWENDEEVPVSRFGLNIETTQPSGGLMNPEDFYGTLKIAYTLNGGVVNNNNIDYHEYYVPAAIIVTVIQNQKLSAVVGMATLLLVLYSLFKKCCRQKAKKGAVDDKDKPIPEETSLCPDPEDLVSTIAEKVNKIADAENTKAVKKS